MTIFRSDLVKTSILTFLAFIAFAFPAMAADQPVIVTDTSPAHMELAKQYAAAVPVEDEIKEAIEQMSSRILTDQRVLFRSIADKNIDYAALRKASEDAVAKTFTTDELKVMVKFFASPEGQSARKKMATYQSLVQPAVADALKKFVIKVQENNITPMQEQPQQ